MYVSIHRSSIVSFYRIYCVLVDEHVGASGTMIATKQLSVF